MEPPTPQSGLEVAPPQPSSQADLVHRVEPGQTLWRIAKKYGVDVHLLAKRNGISDASRLEVGQRLVIPRRDSGSRRSVVGSAGESFIWPVKGKVVSTFGMRREGTINKGIDIQALTGADVVAVRSGQVGFVHENLSGFGKTIILEHADGFATVYAYVGEILVQPGQRVAQRQVIARVGQTGRAQVPTLHFEIRRGQKAGNPLYYLP